MKFDIYINFSIYKLFYIIDNSYYTEMLDFNKTSPVLFCGHRTSGGGMYSGIFDFHPELLVFPHESKFFQIFYPFTELMKFSPEEKINQIINKTEFLRSGFFDVCKADENYFDFKKFIEIFKLEARKNDNWKIILNRCLLHILRSHSKIR